MKKLMKSWPSALSLGIVLSAGGAASAQVAEIAVRGIPSAGAGSAAAASAAAAPLSLTALSPSVAAPSAFAPALAAPMPAAATAALPALPALSAASAPSPVPEPVAEYRRLRGEYQEASRSANDFFYSASEGGSVPSDAYKTVQERDARKAALDAFVAAHPGVKYAAAGTFGRAWLAMTGRAFDGSAAHEDAEPSPVTEYRRLRGEYKDMSARLNGHYFNAGDAGLVLPSYQTLQDVHATLQERAAQKAKIDAFVAANPGVQYAAAGTIGRAWLTATGRAPAAADSAEVAEYRGLRGEYQALTRRLNGLLFTADAGLPSYQTLQDVHETLQKRDAQRAKIDAYVAAHPAVRYAAAGTIGRAWLALTGRAR